MQLGMAQAEIENTALAFGDCHREVAIPRSKINHTLDMGHMHKVLKKHQREPVIAKRHVCLVDASVFDLVINAAVHLVLWRLAPHRPPCLAAVRQVLLLQRKTPNVTERSERDKTPTLPLARSLVIFPLFVWNGCWVGHKNIHALRLLQHFFRSPALALD